MLDRITLSHFRNHAETTLNDTARFNLLVGENGSGKTNVLEALSLLAPGRGLRRASLTDMARADRLGGFSIGASLAPGDGGAPVRLATFVQDTQLGRRRVRINSADSSAVQLGEWLSIGWLTPAMDRLFADGESGRRRFVDRLALAFDPSHAGYATRYDNALRERNRLLVADHMPEPAWFDAIEREVATHGTALSASRAHTVAALSKSLAALPDAPFARPALHYRAGGPQDSDTLASALQEGRRRDRAAGRTLTGPHRDELAVTLAAKDMPAAQCSTGEQKAMLIAIVLAHAARAADDRPNLLLLDEVAAHLDPLRRAALFDRLRNIGAQVWLTGTERAPFTEIESEAAVWRVAGGALTRL